MTGYNYDAPSSTCNGAPLRVYKFTGKERDSESGLDDFGARYYNSSAGRWITPDWSARPEGTPYATLINPQTLNLYAMVQDNPVTFADLDGHACDALACDEFSEKKTIACSGNGGEAVACSPSEAEKKKDQMSLSTKGLEFIKQHEAYSDKVYNDVAGNPTIGYGHLIKEGENFDKGITKEKATELLAQDTKEAVNGVNKGVTVKLSQTQFDALVDFTFNLGAGNLGKSTLLKNINEGKDVTKENFTDWNHAGGKVVSGLTTRRTNEFNLYTNGDYGSP